MLGSDDSGGGGSRATRGKCYQMRWGWREANFETVVAQQIRDDGECYLQSDPRLICRAGAPSPGRPVAQQQRDIPSCAGLTMGPTTASTPRRAPCICYLDFPKRSVMTHRQAWYISRSSMMAVTAALSLSAMSAGWVDLNEGLPEGFHADGAANITLLTGALAATGAACLGQYYCSSVASLYRRIHCTIFFPSPPSARGC